MKELGPLQYFLGVEVANGSHGYSLSQEKYIVDLISRVDFFNDATSNTLMQLH